MGDLIDCFRFATIGVSSVREIAGRMPDSDRVEAGLQAQTEAIFPQMSRSPLPGHRHASVVRVGESEDELRFRIRSGRPAGPELVVRLIQGGGTHRLITRWRVHVWMRFVLSWGLVVMPAWVIFVGFINVDSSLLSTFLAVSAFLTLGLGLACLVGSLVYPQKTRMACASATHEIETFIEAEALKLSRA